MTYERSPLQSKKFVAYLVAELTWKAILVAIILKMPNGDPNSVLETGGFLTLLMTIVIVTGFIEVTLIGGQAALDKYVRVAEIVQNGKPPKAGDDGQAD